MSVNRLLSDALERVAELEKELSKVKAYKAQLLAHVKYTSTQEEVEIIKLEQQAKGRLDGVAYALNMYCTNMSPKEFPAIGDYYANKLKAKAKALKEN